MSWVCINGHTVNDDASTYCPLCQASRPTPINPIAIFVIVMGVFAGPAYPVAGGLAWGAGAAVMLALSYLLDVPFMGVVFVGAVVSVIVFWNTQGLEHAASQHRAYRLLRDVLRVVVGVAIAARAYVANEATWSGGDLFGLGLLVPFGFFVLKRIDLVMGVGPPPDQYVRRIPKWLAEFIDSSNWANAGAMGFFAAVLGFMLGRDARVLTALVLWALTAFIFMLFSGGFAVVAKMRGPRSNFGRLALGLLLGGWLGWFFIHGVTGLAIGAVAGPVALFALSKVKR